MAPIVIYGPPAHTIWTLYKEKPKVLPASKINWSYLFLHQLAFPVLQQNFIQHLSSAIFLACSRGRSRMHPMLAPVHARIPILDCTHASINWWLSSKVTDHFYIDFNFEYILTFWCQLSTHISLNSFKFEYNFDFLVPAFTQI